jgi:hypothetical protein
MIDPIANRFFALYLLVPHLEEKAVELNLDDFLEMFILFLSFGFTVPWSVPVR